MGGNREVNMMTPKETQDAWINAVKSCGQSLIDNAESIAGDFDYQTSTTIYITLEPHSLPEISITHNYLPRDISGKNKVVSLTGKREEVMFNNNN